MSQAPYLPRYHGDDDELRQFLDQFVRALEAQLRTDAVPGPAYAITGATTTRTFNATTAVLADTKNVLASLITDLRTKGLLT